MAEKNTDRTEGGERRDGIVIDLANRPRHHPNCGWHFEQYPAECTCGLTAPRPAWSDVPIVQPVTTCSIEGCSKKPCGYGWCKMHYTRWSRHGDPLKGGMENSKRRTTLCLIEGCDSPFWAKGLCHPHYQRAFKTGSPLVVPKPKKINRWRDGVGYILITVSRDTPNARTNGSAWFMYEHRFVMQTILGRPLLPTESVHHINGVKSDNRPENLELWVKSQPSGQRVRDHLEWARDILRKYGDLVEIAAITSEPKRRIVA